MQAKECYEVIRKHGKKVVVMEMVKGGGQSKLPEEAEKLLKDVNPDKSITSWSLRFAASLDDAIAVLSGMSTIDQVRDNIKTMKEMKALSEEEKNILDKALKIYRESAPIPQSEIDKYKGLKWNGVDVTAILQAYSICQIQPDPGFSDDNNYLKNALIENFNLDLFGELPKCEVILPDGTNKTELVEKCIAWLKENSF